MMIGARSIYGVRSEIKISSSGGVAEVWIDGSEVPLEVQLDIDTAELCEAMGLRYAEASEVVFGSTGSKSSSIAAETSGGR